MSKVFISQENPNIDYVEAKKFGEINFVTDLEFSLAENSLKNEKILEAIKETSRSFEPDHDFIIMSGSPITFGLLFYALALKCKNLARNLNILVWDKRMQQYRLVVMESGKLHI